MDLRSALLIAIVVPAVWLAPGAAATASELPASPTVPLAQPGLAIDIADTDPVVDELRAEYGGLVRSAVLRAGRWEVTYRDSAGEVVGMLVVEVASGQVIERWTGDQAAWPMARGDPAAYGGAFNAPYVFIPLVLAFLAGLLDWRRPLRVVHLDLLVLVSLGLSHAFFNLGETGASVALVYPALAYLAARAAWIGARGPRLADSLRPSLPTSWLVYATLFLVGARLGLAAFDPGVIDVGQASLAGAERLLAGEQLYGKTHPELPTGDTYGPVIYYAYAPFQLLLPWDGDLSNSTTALVAAATFDLGTLGLLMMLGLRLRDGAAGHRLAATMAFAWVAFPYTTFTLVTGANDSFVALLIVAALVLSRRPGVRGAVSMAAVLAKVGPALALPILARISSPSDRGRPFIFAFAATLAAILILVPLAFGAGLELLRERTIEQQLERESPFSLWGRVDGLEPLRTLLWGLLGFAVIVTIKLPAAPSLSQVAAIVAALMLGAQILASHWFYPYAVWFYAPLIVALAYGRGSWARSFRSLGQARAPG